MRRFKSNILAKGHMTHFFLKNSPYDASSHAVSRLRSDGRKNPTTDYVSLKEA